MMSIPSNYTSGPIDMELWKAISNDGKEIIKSMIDEEKWWRFIDKKSQIIEMKDLVIIREEL